MSTGFSVGDASKQLRAALFTAAHTATSPLVLPDHDLLVRRGSPGMQQMKAFDEIVALTRHAASQDFATVGTNRSREQTFECDVVVSVFRQGGDAIGDDDLQTECEDRAFDLIKALEEYVRVTDTTLGGIARHCFCTSTELDGATDLETLKRGRYAWLTATFTAPVRISS